MRIFNWSAVAQPGWFLSDGIHYNSIGGAMRARAIADALARAFPLNGRSAGKIVRQRPPLDTLPGRARPFPGPGLSRRPGAPSEPVPAPPAGRTSRIFRPPRLGCIRLARPFAFQFLPSTTT